jgi:hypothetical protein
MIPAEAWSAELMAAARTAGERNGQVSKAWVGSQGAPDVVGQLLDNLP